MIFYFRNELKPYEKKTLLQKENLGIEKEMPIGK